MKIGESVALYYVFLKSNPEHHVGSEACRDSQIWNGFCLPQTQHFALFVPNDICHVLLVLNVSYLVTSEHIIGFFMANTGFDVT